MLQDLEKEEEPASLLKSAKTRLVNFCLTELGIINESRCTTSTIGMPVVATKIV